MLSRVADSFYWMSRYLERAEHAARVIDVYLSMALDAPTDAGGSALLASIGTPNRSADGADGKPQLSGRLDAVYLTAVADSVMKARENARQIREQISSAMWEQLNTLYLAVGKTSHAHVLDPGGFMRATIDKSHLFYGVTEATLSHDEGWHFMQIGRYLERTITTASMLQQYFSDRHDAFDRPTTNARDHETAGVGLLQACAALEAYCRHYTADIRSDRLAEFLLLNAEFPRSARFAADRVEDSLRAIARRMGRQTGGRPERFAGRLRAALNYGTIDEIIEDSVIRYVESVRKQCAQIHTAIYQTYIGYSIETAIAR